MYLQPCAHGLPDPVEGQADEGKKRQEKERQEALDLFREEPSVTAMQSTNRDGFP